MSARRERTLADDAPEPTALQDTRDVRALARELFGATPDDPAVAHVTAAWAAPDARLRTLAIVPDGPKSPYDAFALTLLRSTADAIVVTGKILRDEPHLRYSLDAVGLRAEPFAALRRETGRESPPRLVVFTSGRGLDPEHPALRGWARASLALPADAPAPPGDLSVLRLGRPDIRTLVQRLRREGLGRVVIEAGPSTSAALYRDPKLVDELWLSCCLGPAPAALAGALPAPIDHLQPTATPVRVPSAEREWRFELRRRDPRQPRGTGSSGDH